jgi:hypothetical protein
MLLSCVLGKLPNYVSTLEDEKMRIVRNIVLTCLGLVAWMWVEICISVPMPERTWPLTAYSCVHSFLLICAVVYLHWALRAFLVPCRGLSKERLLELRRAINAKYAKGFLAGTVGLGYLLLILHTLAYLDRSGPNGPGLGGPNPGFLSGTLFLIVLGTLTQGRAAVQYLCDAQTKEVRNINQ